MTSNNVSQSTRPGGTPGLRPGARPGVGARERAPGGRAFAHGARPGPARTGDVGSSSSGLTTRRRNHEGLVPCGPGSSPRRGPGRSDPRLWKLALGTWNVTSLAGKERELVEEVERYRLDIVGLTSTHSLGSGTQVLERGWTLFFYRLPGEVFRACPTGRKPRGRPRTRWRDYISRLAWERLGIPPEELVEVTGERASWASLLKMLPP